MSLHKRTFPEQEQLTEQLIAHGLEHKTPSQLADAFRLGWQAALGLKTKERADIPPGMALVPISEEQIDSIANDGMRNVSGGIYSVCIYEFVRAIEKHHGIAASQDSAKETK